MRRVLRLPSVCALGLILALPAATQVRRNIPEAEAQRMLKAPVRIDARAAAVLARVRQSYAKLGSLLIESDAGRVKTVTRLKRPLFYHSVQAHKSGEMITLTISNGHTLWDYHEPSRVYVQRDAAVLPRLTLPLAARPFLTDPRRGEVMRNVRGSQTVREFAFSYAGEEKVGAATADRIRVSTLVGSRAGGWRSYDSVHAYDRKSGLLRSVSGSGKRLTFKNTPNAKLPTHGFVWKPIPGSTRSFE